MFAVSWPEVHHQLQGAISGDRGTQLIGVVVAVVFALIGLSFIVMTLRRKQVALAARLMRSCLVLLAVVVGGTLFSFPFLNSLSDPQVVVGRIVEEAQGDHGRVYIRVLVADKFPLSASGKGASDLAYPELRLPVTPGLADAVGVGDSLAFFLVGSGECVGFLDAAGTLVIP